MKKNNLIVSPWKLKFDNKSRIIFLADYSKPENFEDISQYKILNYDMDLDQFKVIFCFSGTIKDKIATCIY